MNHKDSLPPDLRDSVVQITQATSSETRAQSQRRLRIGYAVALIAALGGFSYLSKSPSDLRGFAFVSLAVGSVLLLSALAHFSRPSYPLFWIPLVGLALAPVWLGVVALWLTPIEARAAMSTLGHCRCAFSTLALSTIPVSALLFAHWRRNVFSPTAQSLQVAAIGSSFAAASLLWHCPGAEFWHLALAHALPLWLIGAVVALFARRVPLGF